MKIHCLGTIGYHPNPSRHTACYYLPELRLMLDAGTGLCKLIQLLLADSVAELNILLSHSHLDHVIGLTNLLEVMAVTDLKHVRVYGQADKIRAVQEHLFAPLMFPVPPSFEVIPLEDPAGNLELPQCRIDYFPLEHPGGSSGFVISAQGKRLAYVTDTTPILDTDFINRLTGVDLLLHECNFADHQKDFAVRTGHSWLGAVTEIVERTRAKQTVLIHANPLDELLGSPIRLTSHHQSLNMQFARDDMVIEF